MNDVFKRYLLPGLVFQSVIIGGGYGTGREIAEFFLSHGAVGGLLGMAVAALAWGVVLAIAFEFARITKGYNYRTFFGALLGPVWPVFEILYLLIALLVLSVLGSAAGEMAAETFGLPRFVGAAVLLGAVGALAYWGSKTIERALTFWSIILYTVYGAFFIWVAARFGGDISSALSQGKAEGAWRLDGLRYAAYNLIALAAVLFVLPYLDSRETALKAGFGAGLLGVIPGVFVFLAMLSQYPGVEQEPVPVLSVLQGLNSLWFFVVFQIVLFGTFIETGAGIVHAVNERVASVFDEKGRDFPHWARLAVALSLLGGAIFLASAVGIIDLIAKGYGALSYAFIAIVVAPLLTIGVYRIAAAKPLLTET
ncbi:YkvI family membrane protein [Amphiplicatus metriothermophilus]|uniref:Uncharacterized membrane protein YkvI n=1 Tax=Amphiplicatus metriothermophilus TaxID=1519374 RepID=A0A239PW13_9PROT|nr:hypothetical protein [Amphiplicatus metriothermophilus]MBB5518929.1 putative membrane protein YkvI [Amphiplicatus metriothermophilus]SNT74491.1 Uncharacterized membrane protein YkvI [Amphiplicatus metriothermophilus]